ncbi:hypothetical protein [Gemmiger formicilis]|uniref:Uncharacterized protein n=1 Tax=Subdoligranulum variabile TaxID=214851 RepID=A0A921IMH9_9FIRM|nr:hypothetical protein [Gemmiger formicilis]MBM6898252.1 hypothetical protein [Gemmiger formicilis]HJG28650.1 hypothetical protein [Subdoligranulum variabile]
MKTAKLVVGILSIVLFVLVGMQSCVAGLGNTVSNNGEVGGSAGLLLAVCLLVAGIVAICTRNGGKGGYVSAGFYIVGGLIGLLCAGSYADLNIWSGLSIFFGILCIVGSRKQQ